MSGLTASDDTGPWRLGAHTPCVGCGYDLRGSMASDRCPECGRPVGASLLPLARPQRVARAIRRLGNSYLGLLAIPPVMTGTCLAWVGMAVLALTSLVRVLETAELRFRADAGKLPVVGARVSYLWGAVLLELGLIPVWSCAWALALSGRSTGSWPAQVAGLGFGMWIVAALAGAALVGRVGEAVARQLGNLAIARTLRVQVKLSAITAVSSIGAAMMSALLAVINIEVALVLGGLAIACLGLAVLVVIFMTMAGMSQLAGACERALGASMDAGHAPQVLDVDVDLDDEDLEDQAA